MSASVKNKSFTYAMVVASMVIWAVSYIWVKQALEYYGPFTLVCLRIFLASIFLLGISLIFKKLKRIKKRHIPVLFALAVFDPFGYFLCENYSLQFTSATVASVIISTIPLITPVAAFIFIRERLSLLNIIGIVISFFGVMLVIVKPDFTLATSPLGLILLFSAVLFAVAYTLVLLKLTKYYHVITIITYLTCISAVYFIPVFFTLGYNDFISTPLTTDLVLLLVGLAVFASSLAFILFTSALKVIGASKSNVFSNIIPVFTAIFAWWLLSEVITLQMIIGIGIVVGGLLLSQLSIKNK